MSDVILTLWGLSLFYGVLGLWKGLYVLGIPALLLASGFVFYVWWDWKEMPEEKKKELKKASKGFI